MKLVGGILWGHEIRRRHVVAAVAGLVGLVLALAWQLLPEAGLRWGLAKGLRGLGMVEVSIADTDISLFGGRLTVRKVVAQPALGHALGIGDFDLKFRWKPLLDRRLVLDRVAAEGIDIDLKRQDGGFVLNGLPLAVTAPAASDRSAPAWSIDMAGLELTKSRLRLADGDFAADIAIERLVVENLNSLEPGRAVSFSLKGSLNGAAITLSGTAHPFADEPAFAVAAHAQRLSLADFAALAAPAGVTGLAGQADAAVTAEGALRRKGPDLKVNGRLVLDAPAMDAPVAAKVGRLELELGRLVWDGAKVELAAGLVAEALAVAAPGGGGSAGKLSLDLKALSWDGSRLGLEGRAEGTVLAGKAEGGEGAAAKLLLEAGHLGWDGRRLGWRGGLKLSGAHIRAAGHDAVPESVDWSGRLDLDIAELAGKADGRLALGPLRLVVGDIRTALRAAEAQGWVEFGKAVAGELPKARLDGLSVHDTGRKVDWAEVEKIEADGVRMERDGAVAVARLDAGGLNALRKEGQGGYSWRVTARHLRLGQARRDAKGEVSLDEVHLDGLLARLNRTPEGLVGFEFGDGGAKAGPGDAPRIRVGRLVVGGGSRINLRDRTLAETVRLDVTPLELSITGLDSKSPDRDSPFELKAGVGRGLVVAAGTARPFAEKVSGRIDGKITAFELPPLSPYLAEALGVHLQSGHFDGTLGVGADQGRLSGALDVALSNLFIAVADPNAPVAVKAEMPIETVLDLLRDGEDRIRLSLPIRGDTANPDVDVSDAVAQAVAGALKSTVLTTLKLAFPVAMLIEMAVDADDKAHLALPPLAFAPGADVLSAEHEKALAGIAELMKGRPGLRLTLCGKADDSDWPPVAARRRAADKPLLSRLEQLVGFERAAETLGPPDRNLLSALAQRRTNAARDFLADKGGVETARLFGCRPLVEASGKGPRVELLL
ncbi:hypothetical protein H261_01766 [Paramagnetospirillum caucaseum]|uniref:DUF748 domain-containing protein n=1 Tax=Paramagnetospirillum caucaseum TaxID=1244869 RepID=M3AGE1_9PROT|nr:DUF748 domain-containing protein [Paramagnetospirillum caucaseum]EME71619.1 hypothetical protein H261_01766 [Paramagnetospirillum caucaseum]